MSALRSLRVPPVSHTKGKKRVGLAGLLLGSSGSRARWRGEWAKPSREGERGLAAAFSYFFLTKTIFYFVYKTKQTQLFK